MKISLFVFAAVAAGFAAEAGAANIRPYASIKAARQSLKADVDAQSMSSSMGYESISPNVDDQSGWGYKLALGAGAATDIGGLRAELEFGLKDDVEDNYSPGVGQVVDFSVKSRTVLANVYYDIDAGGGFAPYVGLGFGLARYGVETSFAVGDQTVGAFGSSSRGGTNFAWQVGAGIAYGVTGNLVLDVGCNARRYQRNRRESRGRKCPCCARSAA